MKFTISIKDKRILPLFKFGCDYLEVKVNRTRFTAFAETAELFAVLTLPINSMQDYNGEYVFRIPKAGFFSLLQEGVISFLCEDGIVYIKFENSKISHQMRFEQQICNTPKLDNMLEILRQVSAYPKFEIHDLIVPSKILKNVQTPITVDNKIAVASTGGLQLYAKTVASDCALFPSEISYLSAVCGGDFDRVYNVKDFVVFSDGFHHAIAHKMNPVHSNDIHYINKQKVVYRAIVDFENASQLLIRIRDYIQVDLNLRRQELILKTKDAEYSARITVKPKEKAKAETREMDLDEIFEETMVEIPKISFPAEMFKNIIYAVKSKSLEVVCTKNRVRVYIQPDIMVVCRKERAET